VTLDPADATDGESVKAIESLFDTLVRYKTGSTEVEPSLATEWTVSDDHLTWTFTLREGVTFHDGTPVNAEAVAFSFQRQLDPEHDFHDGEFVYWHDQFSFVKSVEAQGDKTVVFTLDKPFVPFLTNLAMFTASIVSPAQFKKLKEAGDEGATFKNKPVGSGPFKLKEWRRGEAIVLEAFDDHWRGRPQLDQVVLRKIADNNSRASLLQKGDLHGMDGINPADVSVLDEDANVSVVQQPGMNVAYMSFNNLKAPFDDARVRRACAMALDLERVAQRLYYGLAVPAKNPLPPTLQGYNDELAARTQDVEAAKKLLAEAGHPDGFETTLWTMTNPRPYMPQPDKLATYVKNSLKSIGVTVTIVQKEWASYLEEVQNAEHDMCFLGWIGDNGDPDNFLYVLLDKENTEVGKASNYSFYRSEPVHELLTAARVEFDAAKRADLYKQAQALIYEDVPLVPLVHNAQVVAIRANVQGFQLQPTGLLRFADMSVE
jgi:peptide/nickel transport system substrate-binding protein